MVAKSATLSVESGDDVTAELTDLISKVLVVTGRLEDELAGLRPAVEALLARVAPEVLDGVITALEGDTTAAVPASPAVSVPADVAAGWSRSQWMVFIQECGLAVPAALASVRRRAGRPTQEPVVLADLTDPMLAGFMLQVCTLKGPRT